MLETVTISERNFDAFMRKLARHCDVRVFGKTTPEGREFVVVFNGPRAATSPPCSRATGQRPLRLCVLEQRVRARDLARAAFKVAIQQFQ